jgi:hypothetical protein
VIEKSAGVEESGVHRPMQHPVALTADKRDEFVEWMIAARRHVD